MSIKLSLGLIAATILTVTAMFAIADQQVAKEKAAPAASAPANPAAVLCHYLSGDKSCPKV